VPVIKQAKTNYAKSVTIVTRAYLAIIAGAVAATKYFIKKRKNIQEIPENDDLPLGP